jgi:threonine/homoserine/homoserine lactone efflux protein
VIPHMLGITAGFGAMVALMGVGLGGLVHAAPWLHTVLKYAGAAYLLYLAWRIATAAGGKGATARARPIGFVEGALFQCINPKGWVFALGAIAAYTTADGDILLETALITAVLAGTCLVSVVIWGGFGAGIRRWLDRPYARRAFNWTMAGLLVLSLIPVLM